MNDIWAGVIVTACVAGVIFGALAVLAGVNLVARLMWRAGGHEGPLELRQPKPPKIEQEHTE